MAPPHPVIPPHLSQSPVGERGRSPLYLAFNSPAACSHWFLPLLAPGGEQPLQTAVSVQTRPPGGRLSGRARPFWPGRAALTLKPGEPDGGRGERDALPMELPRRLQPRGHGAMESTQSYGEAGGRWRQPGLAPSERPGNTHWTCTHSPLGGIPLTRRWATLPGSGKTRPVKTPPQYQEWG